VVLAWKVIEKCAFANVGGFGDVFDGGVCETFHCEEVQRGAKVRFASGGAAAGATTGFEIVVGGGALMWKSRQ
jgi:hypothetical protein